MVSQRPLRPKCSRDGPFRAVQSATESSVNSKRNCSSGQRYVLARLRVRQPGSRKRALISLRVGAPKISNKEKKHREALKNKILEEMQPYEPSSSISAGIGMHEGFPAHTEYSIPIPEALLKKVAGKIVRGCEYVLGDGRIVENDGDLKVYFAHEQQIQDVIGVFNKFGSPVHLGPGFRVTRAAAHDDPSLVMYKIDIWSTWSIYAVIDSGT